MKTNEKTPAAVGSTGLAGVAGSESFTLMRGTASEIHAEIDELQHRLSIYRHALERIVAEEPCVGDGGACFYPMQDQDGEYIGEQHVDPLAVIGSMVDMARNALSPNIRRSDTP